MQEPNVLQLALRGKPISSSQILATVSVRLSPFLPKNVLGFSLPRLNHRLLLQLPKHEPGFADCWWPPAQASWDVL